MLLRRTSASAFYAVLVILGSFWFLVPTSLTLSSNFRNFENKKKKINIDPNEKPMAQNECQRILMDYNGFKLIPMDPNGSQWIPVDPNGSQ